MPMRSWRWLLFTLALSCFLLDQGSKYKVFRWLYSDGQGGTRQVIDGALELLTQHEQPIPGQPRDTSNDTILTTWSGEIRPRVNHGALFGIGGEHKRLANGFFAAVSLLAALGIAVWGNLRSTRHDLWLSVALGLILSGTLGNFYDRVVFGGVRDFLHFYLFEWPVFNFADCCLVVGAGILLLQAAKPAPNSAATATANPEPVGMIPTPPV